MAATAEDQEMAATAEDWIFEKQRRLDLHHEMVIDKCSWQNGRELQYGSLHDDARRWLLPVEMCTFHPVQAVTAQKEASGIGVGDVVFCQVQRSQQFYAHLVLSIEHDYHAQEPKYWIGNIEQRVNGWCFREHIYGILVQVQVGAHLRPLPKRVYEEVRKLVADHRWSQSARRLCEPPSSEGIGIVSCSRRGPRRDSAGRQETPLQ